MAEAVKSKKQKQVVGITTAAVILLLFLGFSRTSSAEKTKEEEQKTENKEESKKEQPKEEGIDFGSIEITDSPVPGYFYRMKFGDSLLGISKKAYASGDNLKNSQMINSHYYNRRFWLEPKGAFNKKYYKDGFISFFPDFGNFVEQVEDEKWGSENQGSNYPIIFIPEFEDQEIEWPMK